MNHEEREWARSHGQQDAERAGTWPQHARMALGIVQGINGPQTDLWKLSYLWHHRCGFMARREELAQPVPVKVQR